MASLSVLNILRAIKDRGTVSRTQLQATTGLSWGTITNTTRDLLNRNLIREQGTLSTKAGRKPVRLAINPNSHGLIGIDLSPGIARCQLLSLLGETLGYEEFDFQVADAPETVLERLAQSVQRILELPIMAARTCLGIGVSVPGNVDPDRGTLRFSARMPNWKGMAIRPFLQDRLNPQVRMERESNCLALAERWFGEAGQADDVLCVNLGETVGLGIISGGEVFRGSQHLAGDFGHTTVDPNGPRCACGDHGCLDAYASLAAVREYARALPEKHSPALASSFAGKGPTLAELIAAAAAGDAAVEAALARMGKHLGIGIANLIDLFNPGLTVLAGPLSKASPWFMPALMAEIEKHAHRDASRRLVISQLGDRATATGACGIVMQSIFEVGQVASSELQQA